MHLKTLSGLLLCLLAFAGTLAAQVDQSIVPEKIVIGVESGGSVLQFTVTVNTPVPVSAGMQLPEEYYVLSLAAAPELSLLGDYIIGTLEETYEDLKSVKAD